MTDHADLRRAANAATPWEWEYIKYDDHFRVRVKDKPELSIARSYGDSLGDNNDINYIALANPSRILAVLGELEAAQAITKRLSDALLKVRPLGGSECFVKHGDGFVADPDYLGVAIDEMKTELHKARCDEVSAAKAERSQLSAAKALKP